MRSSDMSGQNKLAFRIDPYCSNSNEKKSEGEDLFKLGVEILASKHFGVIILAGGQGSRLGSNEPKALYKVAGRPLIEHHIIRIKKLIKDYKCHIKLFIMVSSYTERSIKEYIEDNDFGIPIELIKQEDRVCRDKNGEIMYNEQNEPIKAPGGNGDVFKAFKDVDIKDYEGVNVISIDNVLAKVLDPMFVGAFVRYDCDIMSKAVTKKEDENVGIFCMEYNKLTITEYMDKCGKAGNTSANICNHLFSRQFMELMRDKNLPEHRVLKKVPFFQDGKWIKPEQPNCYKVETFIFDSFEYARRNAYMTVPREYEFSPLKNGMDSETDNPQTCEEALRRYGEE